MKFESKLTIYVRFSWLLFENLYFFLQIHDKLEKTYQTNLHAILHKLIGYMTHFLLSTKNGANI